MLCINKLKAPQLVLSLSWHGGTEFLLVSNYRNTIAVTDYDSGVIWKDYSVKRWFWLGVVM